MAQRVKQPSPGRTRPATRTKPSSAGSVDSYLASLPPDVRTGLQKLREAIRAAAPTAEEGFSYGLPAFKLDGRPLVCYAASKNHSSFYPMSAAVMQAHLPELKAYEASKGTIRFAPNKPPPATLVKKVVKTRIAELQARKRRPIRPPPRRVD